MPAAEVPHQATRDTRADVPRLLGRSHEQDGTLLGRVTRRRFTPRHSPVTLIRISGMRNARQSGQKQE
jgi:hypothetical protein